MHLTTERLILRPMQPNDIPALVALWMDADATRYMGGPRERDGVQLVVTRGLILHRDRLPAW